MTTTTTRPADAAHELPELAAADRLALTIGTRLILWGERDRQRRAERAARAEHARTARAAEQADAANAGTFERRTQAGPRW
jgi:hypothetical protein